uniref:hypothetical protein n=1 Tax=Bidens pilosa TaxID=42337 RepID=UPI001FF29F99|nr:hypothetical protein MZG22_mgp34 [Bidens pilosa]UIR99250.1 hypothetical protein [Bidens pilosa]
MKEFIKRFKEDPRNNMFFAEVPTQPGLSVDEIAELRFNESTLYLPDHLYSPANAAALTKLNYLLVHMKHDCGLSPSKAHFLVKALLAFFLLAGLILSCHTGTGGCVFMDDLSRAVQQFCPGSGSSGAFSNPTPPPGNSGGAYIVPITQQREGERPAETPQLFITDVVSQFLLEYRNRPEVIKEFPWLMGKNHETLVSDFFRENLDIGGKTEKEILDLSKLMLRKKEREPLFKSHFDRISPDPEEISKNNQSKERGLHNNPRKSL